MHKKTSVKTYPSAEREMDVQLTWVALSLMQGTPGAWVASRGQ